MGTATATVMSMRTITSISMGTCTQNEQRISGPALALSDSFIARALVSYDAARHKGPPTARRVLLRNPASSVLQERYTRCQLE